MVLRARGGDHMAMGLSFKGGLGGTVLSLGNRREPIIGQLLEAFSIKVMV